MGSVAPLRAAGRMTAAITPAADLNKALAKAMKESELQAHVNKALHQFGWRFTHFRTAITSKGAYVTALAGDKGFPDVIAIRGSRLLFAELKREQGKLEPEQEVWADAIRGCMVDVIVDLHTLRRDGPEYHLWRPSNWLDGSIVAVLQ